MLRHLRRSLSPCGPLRFLLPPDSLSVVTQHPPAVNIDGLNRWGAAVV